MSFGGGIQAVVEAAHPTVSYAHAGNLLRIVEVADIFLCDAVLRCVLEFIRHVDGECQWIVVGLWVIAGLTAAGHCRLVVCHLCPQLRGIDVMKFSEGVEQWDALVECLCFAWFYVIGADDLK